MSQNENEQSASLVIDDAGDSTDSLDSQDLSPDLSTLASVMDFEPLAKARLSEMAYEYLSAGASDEITLRWNKEAFDTIRLRPRVLVDVSKIDTSSKLLGQELPHPILLAPCAYHGLFHPEAEIETARGANAGEAIFVISTMASVGVEEIVQTCKTPPWFQLYVQPDRGYTRELIQRIEDAGCAALCVTVDTPVIGTRNRETRVRFQLPDTLRRPHLEPVLGRGETTHRPKEGQIYSSFFSPSLNWKDIEWMKSFLRVPLLLKGVMSGEDGEIAAQVGVDGIVVSNHGARNLDTVPAAIEALPEVVERVAGRIPVLIDGGIRRGIDILKSLALGADAVMIGRPYLYGLSAAGAAGVAKVLNILRTELAMAMALTGCTSIEKINQSVLWDVKARMR
jgi:4-hydroxymandelate oxidase